MYYGERQMIEGVPGDENTAVTMRAIKDILAEAGASDMIINERTQAEAAAQGPLGNLAARAARHGAGLQMPPPVGSVRVRPHVPQPTNAQQQERGGLLPRLFGRK